MERFDHHQNQADFDKGAVENEYLDNIKSDHLNPVWLNPVLKDFIRESGWTA